MSTVAPTKSSAGRRTVGLFAVGVRPFMMVIALAIMWIVFAWLTDGVFVSPRNCSNLFRQMATTGVVATGMAVCIIAGYFDLSVGSVVGVSGALSAVAMYSWGVPASVAVALALALGLAIGLWQGCWVAYGRVPAFIVTLGGLLIFRGVVLLLTNSNAVPISEPNFLAIGQSYLPRGLGTLLGVVSWAAFVAADLLRRLRRVKDDLPVPAPAAAGMKYVAMGGVIALFVAVMNSYEGLPVAVIIVLTLVLLFAFLLNNTRYGRYAYAVGGNSEAARFSGVDSARVTVGVFVVTGVLSALAGVILDARLATSVPANGTGFELDAIAACVIGGVSLAGGRGSVWGALVGALVIATLSNGMSLLSLPSSIQAIINGLVLIVAVWFDVTNAQSK